MKTKLATKHTYTVTLNGKVIETRKSDNLYTHVVAAIWSDGEANVWSFHSSQALAAKTLQTRLKLVGAKGRAVDPNVTITGFRVLPVDNEPEADKVQGLARMNPPGLRG